MTSPCPRADHVRATRSLAILVFACLAGSPSPALAQQEPDGAGDSTTVRFHGIEVDIQKREMRVQGRVLLDRGLIELVATAPGGKEHESILVLDCRPDRFQTGLVILGLETGKPVQFQGENRAPSGAAIEMVVAWIDAEGNSVEVPAEDLVWNQKTGAPMPRVGWVFTGGRFVRDPRSGREVFMADVTGVMVATYHDPDAILDTPTEEGADDTVYAVNSNIVPPPGTPVTVFVRPREAAGPGGGSGD